MMKKLLRNRFVTAAIWMYSASAVTSFGNYLFHLVMARMLKPASLLGELESVLAFFYILSVPLATLSLVIVKFISMYKGQGNPSAIHALYYYVKKLIVIYSAIGVLTILLLSPFITNLLHLSSNTMILLLLLNFFIGVFVVFGRSILQGVTNFFILAISNIVESFSKLAFGIVLVLIGLKTTGAFAAIALSGIVGYLPFHFFFKKNTANPGAFTDQRALYKYALPVFISILSITSLYSADIVLVRYFFPGNESGDYAVLSILGKVIYFAVSPVTAVLFPFVSETHARGEKYAHYLLLSFIFTLLGAVTITAIYFLFPDVIIYLLPGKNYLLVAPLLGMMGIFLGLYSLCVLMANFYLSIHKTKQNFFIVSAAIAQILGIYFFHNDLSEVIQVSIVVSFVLLISLLLYYPYVKDRK